MWDAWVLVVWCALAGAARLDSPDLSLIMLQGEGGPLAPRRITPKSVFVAPTFQCSDGYQQDSRGRCVRVVRLNQAAQWEFFLKKLNSMYAASAPPPGGLHQPRPQPPPPSGPLRLPIPIDSPPPTTTTSPPTTSPPPPATTDTPTPTELIDVQTTEMNTSGEGEMEIDPAEEYEREEALEESETSTPPTPPMMTTARFDDAEEAGGSGEAGGGGGEGPALVRCREGVGVSRVEDAGRLVDCEPSEASAPLRFPYEGSEAGGSRVRFPQEPPPPFSWPPPVTWEINTYPRLSYQRLSYQHRRRQARPQAYP